MNDYQHGITAHPESQRALNRLLAIEQYSAANYLAHAPPWTCSADEPLLEAVRRIAAGQRAEVLRIGRLLVRRYNYAESGRFPAQFTEYNDLALEYLVGRLIEHEGLMIDEIGRCADELAADPEAKRLAEDALAGERRHLGLLTPLALADGQGAPGPEQPGTIS